MTSNEEFNEIISQIREQSELIEKKYIDKNKQLKAILKEMVVTVFKLG